MSDPPSAEHFTAMRAIVAEVVPPSWPSLRTALDDLLATQPRFVMLPLHGATAVGASSAIARPVGVAGAALSLAYRLLDDVADGDRPNALVTALGPARAVNAATGSIFASMLVLTNTSWPAERGRRALSLMSGCGMRAALGQDRDLDAWASSISEHCWLMREKNGRIYGALCGAGAAVGTDDPKLVEACFRFGMHLGVVLQIADDLEGAVSASGNDARRGHVTLPLAMLQQAPRTEAGSRATDWREWSPSALEQALRAEGVVGRVLAYARHHHDLALEALEVTESTGRSGLVNYANEVLTHLERWCAAPSSQRSPR